MENKRRGLGVELVDNDRVAVWIEDHGHAADGGGEGFHAEFYAGFAELGDGGVEVVHFKGDRATVGAGVPTGGGADAEVVLADLVFDPLRIFDRRRGEAEDALVEGAGAGE